jgi:hypothetical protein
MPSEHPRPNQAAVIRFSGKTAASARPLIVNRAEVIFEEEAILALEIHHPVILVVANHLYFGIQLF